MPTFDPTPHQVLPSYSHGNFSAVGRNETTWEVFRWDGRMAEFLGRLARRGWWARTPSAPDGSGCQWIMVDELLRQFSEAASRA